MIAMCPFVNTCGCFLLLVHLAIYMYICTKPNVISKALICSFKGKNRKIIIFVKDSKFAHILKRHSIWGKLIFKYVTLFTHLICKDIFAVL